MACSQADVLVAAVGQPEFVQGDWIKEGAVTGWCKFTYSFSMFFSSDFRPEFLDVFAHGWCRFPLFKATKEWAMCRPAWTSIAEVVIDVGINRVEDSSRKRGYRLTGDVHFDTAKDKASLITPVPGGH